jgi:murein DD-endopeptidase MepM/ murein hydrolase activator NlpD
MQSIVARLHEVKWDGYATVATVIKGKVRSAICTKASKVVHSLAPTICVVTTFKESPQMKVLARSIAFCFLAATFPLSAADSQAQATQFSSGRYRLPFSDGTMVKVFDDFQTHHPVGRIDLFAIDGHEPYQVVAAAPGQIVAIQDQNAEQQSGRAAADCHNNYVWIAHPNGEWTNYSHLAKGSVTSKAKLKVGDHVASGQYLGDEDAIGCAMLKHVHFEVAVPNNSGADAIDGGGFLVDNDNGKRERNPRFCGVVGYAVVKDRVYSATPCESSN